MIFGRDVVCNGCCISNDRCHAISDCVVSCSFTVACDYMISVLVDVRVSFVSAVLATCLVVQNWEWRA